MTNHFQMSDFRGAARRIEDVDLPRIGSRIGVGEDTIHAVIDVELAGSGFDKQGRPRMLFEPHIFWRRLGPGPERDEAASQGLAYPRWKPGSYPSDSYPRLIRAANINGIVAFESASWGMGQIMGFNARMCGFMNAGFMLEAFLDDEAAHLEAMIEFIVSAGLDDELRRRDWRGFARGYNGPGYEKNGYHIKLAKRYEWWSKRPDTPWSPDGRQGDALLLAAARWDVPERMVA